MAMFYGLNDADRADLVHALVLFRFLGVEAGAQVRQGRLRRTLELADKLGIREGVVRRLHRTPIQAVRMYTSRVRVRKKAK